MKCDNVFANVHEITNPQIATFSMYNVMCINLMQALSPSSNDIKTYSEMREFKFFFFFYITP
jgi:hypothetical protein